MDVVFANTQGAGGGPAAVLSHPHTGLPVTVMHGQHWPADDPVVRAYPNFFDKDPRYGLSSSLPLDDDGYPVHPEKPARASETTTAAPGERRTRARARKSTATKKAAAKAPKAGK